MTKTAIKPHSPDKNKTQCKAHANTDTVPMHCLREVRRREKVSQETIANRLGIDVGTVEQIENESTDIPLSLLYEWKELLDVPIVDLLVDTDNAFDSPQKMHARLEALTRTAIMLAKQNRQTAVAHMAHNLVNQLLEIMPELRQVISQYGSQPHRRLEEYGLDIEQDFLDEMATRAVKR